VEKGAALDVGFEGIWVTCARGAEKKAMAELTTVCAQVRQRPYGLINPQVLHEEESV
jgi:tRNA acetyltransferase TAN1